MEEITIIKAMLIVLFTIYLLTLIVLLQVYLELKDFFKEIKTDKEEIKYEVKWFWKDFKSYKNTWISNLHF